MRRLALALLASTSLLGLASVAEAADLAIRKAPPLPPPPPLWSWTGFYVGAHIGAGQSRKEFTTKDPFSFDFFDSQDGFVTGFENSKRGSHNAIGGLGGVQAGFNWQAGVIVFGVEAQYSWARLKGDHQDSFSLAFADEFDDDNFRLVTGHTRFSTEIKGIGTIAGRLGLVSGPQDRTLFYVKGGAAYVKEDFSESTRGTDFDCFDDNCFSQNYSNDLSASRHRWGWMVGAGIELGLWDNWSAKVEYNYMDFKDDTVKLTGTECFQDFTFEKSCNSFSRDHKVDQNIQLIKFGLNYRFGPWGKAPAVMAKY